MPLVDPSRRVNVLPRIALSRFCELYTPVEHALATGHVERERCLAQFLGIEATSLREYVLVEDPRAGKSDERRGVRILPVVGGLVAPHKFIGVFLLLRRQALH